MEDKSSNRKDLRLKHYDYSQVGYYFVTLCTENKERILCDIVGEQSVGVGFHADPTIRLTAIGKDVEKSILILPILYNGVQVDQYVIMPNHIHLIIALEGGHGNPPLQDIVGRMKSFTTKRYNEIKGEKYLRLWQRNYYEHVIRKDSELHEVREYIVNNPAKWELDKYYNS